VQVAPGESHTFPATSDQVPEIKIMVNSLEERGYVKGIHELVLKQLEKKFGKQPDEVFARLQTLSAERLIEIGLLYTDVTSLDELRLGDD
jgi:hypothetical protein